MNAINRNHFQSNHVEGAVCPNCWGYTEWNATFERPVKKLEALSSKMKGFIQTFTDKYLPTKKEGNNAVTVQR